MAKVTLSPEFESMSGKLCRKSNSVVAVNKQTGKMYRYDSHPGTQPNSTKQKAIKTKFKTKAQAAATWWNENKELVNEETGAVTREATADMKKVLKAYKAQYKYGNPFTYLRSLVQDDGTIALPGGGTSAASGGTTTNPTDNPNREDY